MSSQSSLPPKSHYLLSYPLTPRQDVCILIHESSVPTQTSIYPHKSRCGQSVLDHLVHWLVHQFICCFIFFVCWFTFWFPWFSSRFSCFSYWFTSRTFWFSWYCLARVVHLLDVIAGSAQLVNLLLGLQACSYVAPHPAHLLAYLIYGQA